MTDATTVVIGFMVVVLICVLIVFGPLLTIWSLNTLFPSLAIGYSIKTWFAALILGGIASRGLSATGSTTKSS